MSFGIQVFNENSKEIFNSSQNVSGSIVVGSISMNGSNVSKVMSLPPPYRYIVMLLNSRDASRISVSNSGNTVIARYVPWSDGYFTSHNQPTTVLVLK